MNTSPKPDPRNDFLPDSSEVWQLIGGLILHLAVCCLLIVTLGFLADSAHASEEIGLIIDFLDAKLR